MKNEYILFDVSEYSEWETAPNLGETNPIGSLVLASKLYNISLITSGYFFFEILCQGQK